MAKKLSAGAFIICATAVLALVGLIAYLVNTGTNYYAKMGVDTVVVVCLIAVVLIAAVRFLVGRKGDPAWADILPVAAVVAAVAALMMLLNARINNLAAVFTFENSAANMADTTSCFVAIGAVLLTVILTMAAAFCDVAKEQ